MLVGWGYSRLGALEQPEIGYALAMFGTLLDLPDRYIKPHLSKNPWTFYKMARKNLRRRQDRLAELRAVGDPLAKGPYR